VPKHTRRRLRPDEPVNLPILLVRIARVEGVRYRLDFDDGPRSVSFVLELVPRRGVHITSEFAAYFKGRSSCTEALQALARFADGEAVSLPMPMTEDGWIGFG
jgi:hypothetical protein